MTESPIPYVDVHESLLHRVRVGLYLGHAHDLGLTSGTWPALIRTANATFSKRRAIQNGGWRYETDDGIALEVLND